MKIKRILSIALSLILLAGTLTQFISVSADTQDDLQENKFYISRDGNDGKDGKSRANAVRNVKRVIELINAAGLAQDGQKGQC